MTPLVSGVALALWGLALGAVIGAVIGLVGHAMAGGRRDFSSVGGLRAGRYHLLAEPGAAAEARRLLGEAGVTRAA